MEAYAKAGLPDDAAFVYALMLQEGGEGPREEEREGEGQKGGQGEGHWGRGEPLGCPRDPLARGEGGLWYPWAADNENSTIRDK